MTFLENNSFRSSSTKIGTRSGTSRYVVSLLTTLEAGTEESSFKLKAVNGSSIATYGTRKLSLQIGRKQYSIDAIIAHVPQVIFGWDLFKKYSLGGPSSYRQESWHNVRITSRNGRTSVHTTNLLYCKRLHSWTKLLGNAVHAKNRVYLYWRWAGGSFLPW